MFEDNPTNRKAPHACPARERRRCMCMYTRRVAVPFIACIFIYSTNSVGPYVVKTTFVSNVC